ncbi:IS66-like element accessory protein TnpA [Ferruginivarius sediminum]|uniref:IS66-like element accessory protein TnpA n=1 Tax=Ferruginivarius sediminum TaxID=2661937 RepID=UPI0019D46582|nr:transposase [Ferruginivarius sediminum]
MSRLEVVETGRRRRWGQEAKVRIVEESMCGAHQASATARRYRIATSLLFKWRKAYRAGELGNGGAATFMPAVVVPEGAVSPPPTPSPGHGQEAAGGRMEIVAADVDPAALARVLEVLEAR